MSVGCEGDGNEIKELWNDWELCDKCGYRYHVIERCSPDDHHIQASIFDELDYETGMYL